MSEILPPAITVWLAYLGQKSKSQSTVDNYRRALAHFIHWSEHSYGQPFDLATTIPRDVADWKAFQQTVEKAKPATVNVRLVGLSRFRQRWTACARKRVAPSH